MLQPELLIRKVIQTLEAAGIEYMLTGSVVSSLQGEPRSTHDIDLVVALPKSAVASLVETFPSPDFYLSEDRYVEEIGEVRIQVSSPEDTILAKLRWAQLSGGSERQFGDALRVYEVQFETLDQSYLASWAKALNVESLWNRLQEEAIII